ncbi:MAG: hypothetical protein ACOC32_02425 [Nanoarchaeota archaeon]
MLLNKKAEGISHMIMFLAAIIVAGVAASVLMQTGSNLQNQALESGKKSQDAVRTSIEVMNIHGEDGRSPQGTIRNFFMTLRLAPGSKGINLEEMLIEGGFQYGSAETVAVKHNGSMRNCTIGTDASDSGFWTDPSSGNGTFSYTYVRKGNQFKDGYLLNGDLITVCFRAPYEIQEDAPFSITLTTLDGQGTSVETMIPDVVNMRRVQIYP